MVIKCNGKRYSRSVVRGKILIALFFFYVEIHVKILSLFSESFLHLLLWLIFRQPHRVCLKNLDTTDKKSSHKIKHKKIPRIQYLDRFPKNREPHSYINVINHHSFIVYHIFKNFYSQISRYVFSNVSQEECSRCFSSLPNGSSTIRWIPIRFTTHGIPI